MKTKLTLIVIGAALVGVIVLIILCIVFKWPLFWLIPLTTIGIILLILLILVGYKAQWTGFPGYDKITKEKTYGQPTKTTKEYQPGKTFWDWLQLLIIPIVLAGATIGFGWWQAHLADLQHQQDQQIALDQQQATTLQKYIDNIQDLLLNHNLLRSNPGNPENPYYDVATIARARTLTALDGLDPHRKGVLIQFLYEANLIGSFETIILGIKGTTIIEKQETHFPIIFLFDANLSGTNLSNQHLAGATLSRVTLTNAILNHADLYKTSLDYAHLNHSDLSFADLSQAYLNFTDLTGATDLTSTNLTNAILLDANLTGANLTVALLNHADLTNANLTGANLTGALLTDANLTGANLEKANITQEQLAEAKSLKGATMPDGSIHP